MDIFFGGWTGGLLGLLRLPGRESESIGPVHRIWRGGGLRGPDDPLLISSKRGSTTFRGRDQGFRGPGAAETVPTGLPRRIERAPHRSAAYTQWILAAWPSNPKFFLQGFGTRQDHS